MTDADFQNLRFRARCWLAFFHGVPLLVLLILLVFHPSLENALLGAVLSYWGTFMVYVGASGNMTVMEYRQERSSRLPPESSHLSTTGR